MAFPVKHLTVGGNNNPFLTDLLASINHATEIRIAAAFISPAGLNLIIDALRDALRRKATVRILTGDYLNFTDPAAFRMLMWLQEQGAEVWVFEGGGTQNFHMKAYLFVCHADGEPNDGCIYIGSSNITRVALQNGLEWNLRVSLGENESRFAEVLTEYHRLFEDKRCKPLSHQWINEYILRRPVKSEVVTGLPETEEQGIVFKPKKIQKAVLAALIKSREEGDRRGLVVMATGLGKTWLAAFDCEAFQAKKVLFIAHREEILTQAENTFLRIKPNASVGKYNAKIQQPDVDMLFASVFTLGQHKHLTRFDSKAFDYIVIDEFHHASAQSYRRLLAHFEPEFMLGLTATPDRTDQSDILSLCDDNLICHIDLAQGIEADELCPFKYYGIGDVEVNYTEIKWHRSGFKANDLHHLLATTARAAHNFKEWQKRRQTRTLAFCITTDHADFMADYFDSKGVSAVAVHSKSKVMRNKALNDLREHKIDIIFSVDLFNEGVDLPEIDTVLMLRPTESKIVFLQQLGRGLRTCDTKSELVVIDFIGNHKSFFNNAIALFKVGAGKAAQDHFIRQAASQSLPLPKGCFLNYDSQAIEFMEQYKEAKTDAQTALYRALKDSLNRRPTLAEFYRAENSDKDKDKVKYMAQLRKRHDQWLQLVEKEGDLSDEQSACLQAHGAFFKALEKTNLEKCFKLVLLEAMLELQGFVTPLKKIDLALQSWKVLQRRQARRADLKEAFQPFDELPVSQHKNWLRYWQENPIVAWAGKKSDGKKVFFAEQEELFLFKQQVTAQMIEAFELLTQELVDYCYARYENRVNKNKNKLVDSNVIPTPQIDNVMPIKKVDKLEVPYFADLEIACGHFRSSSHDTDAIETKALPISSYPKLNPDKHFIARAKGNSMNGGKHPIKDGDYLLFERVYSIDKIRGQTIVIERQDVTGDDQYLLRNAHRLVQGGYELIAQNPDYEPIVFGEGLKPVARLLMIIEAGDL